MDKHELILTVQFPPFPFANLRIYVCIKTMNNKSFINHFINHLTTEKCPKHKLRGEKKVPVTQSGPAKIFQ
jgi:hypothetical protein